MQLLGRDVESEHLGCFFFCRAQGHIGSAKKGRLAPLQAPVYNPHWLVHAGQVPTDRAISVINYILLCRKKISKENTHSDFLVYSHEALGGCTELRKC